MGSDLSKPKNRKNKGDCSDGTSSNGKRNSRTMCYDASDCYDPCQSVKFAPLQLPPFPRQQPRYPRDPRDMYKDFDPPSDIYDRSAVVSNLQLSPRTSTRKLVCYECPEKMGSLSSSRAPRYKTAKPVLKREDTFGEDDYKESRETRKEPRRYTVVSSTRERERDRDRDRERERERDPIYYSEGKNVKIDDYDGIPKERIYEIRKEKILIKADKSPERYRSKSSEKYLDNKSTDYKSYDDGTGTYKVYEREDVGGSSSTRKQLQSRSVYVLKDDRESSPERSSYSERKYNNSTNKTSSSKTKSNSNGNGSDKENNANAPNVPTQAQPPQVTAPAINSTCNTDIVYVPMVKEDFLKRECKKLENPELKY